MKKILEVLSLLTLLLGLFALPAMAEDGYRYSDYNNFRYDRSYSYDSYDRHYDGGQSRTTGRWVILGANDLGMHCMQDDYSAFMVLPPANTVRVQVLRNGRPVSSGVEVTYAYANHTKNPDATTNFWSYADDYGFSGLSTGQGVTGNFITGKMEPNTDGISFSAEFVPITPYDDNGNFNAYPVMTVTAKDTSGNVLATQDIVTPTSTEMSCFRCHGTNNTGANILQSHDKNSGTHLYDDYLNQQNHACSECHQDNALGRPGVSGVKSLSEAMHGFHADKIYALPESNQLTPECYNCHPGPSTACLRGTMAADGLLCADCHGDMYQVTESQVNGRQAWLEEPKCADCHDASHSENANTLYRNSILNNSIEGDMNGKYYCESCHNSTHSEWPSMNAKDNQLPIKLQGTAGPITCVVCHGNSESGRNMHK